MILYNTGRFFFTFPNNTPESKTLLRVEIDFYFWLCYKFNYVLLRWSAAICGGNRSSGPALKIKQATPWIAAESLQQGAFRRKSSTVFLFYRPVVQVEEPARAGPAGTGEAYLRKSRVKRERIEKG